MIYDIRFRSRNLGGKLLYLLFELLLVSYCVIIILPLVNMVLSSFKNTREIFLSPYSLPKTFSLLNYETVWIHGKFYLYFINSILVTGVAVGLVLLFGSFAAFGIARYRYRGSSLIYVLFLSGILLPLRAAVIPLFLIMTRLSLTNTLVSIIIIYLAMGLPPAVFILTGFMRTIPRDFEDAARIDGCNDFRIYRSIILPLVRQALALVTIYVGMPIWNDFFFPLVFIQTESLRTLPLGMTRYFGQYSTNWALIFAGLSISILPMILLYVFLSKSFIKGMTVGAIK